MNPVRNILQQIVCMHCMLLRYCSVRLVHVLQFLTGCDYVLVMKDGRISEEGSHEELMTHENGEYAELIKSFHDTEEKEKAKEVDVGESLSTFIYLTSELDYTCTC